MVLAAGASDGPSRKTGSLETNRRCGSTFASRSIMVSNEQFAASGMGDVRGKEWKGDEEVNERGRWEGERTMEEGERDGGNLWKESGSPSFPPGVLCMFVN